MSEFAEVEIITAQDTDTGETIEAVRVPKGFYLCLITPSTAARFAEWTEAKAVRIRTDGDMVAELEVTNDEDWVTGPEAGA